MPIPVADRLGRLNAPRVQAGRAPSAAQYESNIGQIGENTMKMLARSTNEMARAVTYMQRQQEQMAAQDALTEYLAGREKLDTVRNSLALENAVDFEDKYYEQAEKMHKDFLGKINGLKYADIRERARGQANEVNINGAARAESYFFKQKEAVNDNHTAALIDLKTRDTSNSISSNPGMANYNIDVVRDGYMFVLDTAKNRLIEKGYRDGTPEMDLAMSKEKDKYFSTMLEEVSHRPDDGLHLAHSLGKVFKQEMTPAMWNQVMKPISTHNLSEELQKDATRFFTGGDVMNGEINKAAAAKESVALDDAERRAFLENFQTEYRKGKTAENAARDVDFSNTFMWEQAEWVNDHIGTYADLLSGDKLKELTQEQTKEISDYLQKNLSVTELVNQIGLWNDNMKKLTLDDQKKLQGLQTRLIRIMFDNPNISRAGLEGTFFEGKNPSVEEVAYAAFLATAYESAKEHTWRDTWLNPFGVFGESPVSHRSATNVRKGLMAVRDVLSNPEWRNRNFDDLSTNEQFKLFSDLSARIERETSPAYAIRLGQGKGIKEALSPSISSYANDIMGKKQRSLVDVLTPTGALKTINAYSMAALYYGDFNARQHFNESLRQEIPSMTQISVDESGNIYSSTPYKKKELKTIFPDAYSFYKNKIDIK